MMADQSMHPSDGALPGSGNNPDQDTANITETDLRIYAMGLLARREYATTELFQRLLTKWRNENGIEALAEQVVGQLVQEGSISDERYLESFIRSRIQRCHGPLKVRAELAKRGLSESLVSRGMEKAEVDWAELAAQWLQQQQPGTLDYRNKARFYRRLVNRGFSHEQSMDALSHCSGQAGDFEYD